MDHYEALAHELGQCSDFRVLRRLRPRRIISPDDGSPTKMGLFVDVETTGLDPGLDEVIELAMVPFRFAADGRIFDIGDPFRGYREPTRPVPDEVSHLTGLTIEDLRGHQFDQVAVERYLSAADLIVAHHADFDRKFVERISETAMKKGWACSMMDIDWKAEGFDSTKLEYLALKSGFFYESHRAVCDCFAGIELLSRNLVSTKRPAMMQLIERAAKETSRVTVSGVAFASNGVLKSRGYRFAKTPKGEAVWVLECDGSTISDEEQFLASLGTGTKRVDRLSSFDRFSAR